MFHRKQNRRETALIERTVNKATSEHELIARCRQGDESAFRELVDQYKGIVFALTSRSAATRERAEDGGMVITYVLQANPRLTEIKLQGNSKIKDSAIKKKITSKVGEALDERKLFTDTQAIQELYQKKEVAEALRHYSCQFVIEWGIDLDAALPKLQRSDSWLAKAGIAKTAEGYQATKTWIGGTKNRIKPLVWWDETDALKDTAGQKQAELPGTKKLWHYNPIAFLEAYSELNLEKQKNP